MQEAAQWDLAVIGAGIAGLSTAIWARRLGLSPIVLEQNSEPGGQLLALSSIPDYPGLPDLNGRELAAAVYRQALDAGADIRLGTPVIRLDPATHQCETPTGCISAKAVVLATGVSPRRLGVPGEAELHRKGLIRRPSTDLPWFAGRRVAVVGGGDRAVENALLLAPVAAAVVLIHRGPSLRARESLASHLPAADNLRLMLNTRVTAMALAAPQQGHPTAGPVSLRLCCDGKETEQVVDAVCIYIGNGPNTALFQCLATGPDGALRTDAHCQTSMPGIYAVGDVNLAAEYQSLISAASQGMVAAKQIALSRR